MIKAIILVLGTLVVGIVCLISPMRVIKFQKLLHKSIYSNLFGMENISSINREAFDLIENDPSAYKHRFWLQILAIRIMGIIALFMFFMVLLAEVSKWFI